MAWVPITEKDIEGSITPSENTALRIRLKEDDAPDPLGAMISQVTAKFRDAVRSGGRVRLTEDPTLVPDGAVFDLVAIIRHRLLGKFGVGEITDDRVDEFKAANAFLTDVRRGVAAVEDPFEGEGATQKIPPLSVSDPDREFRWRDQDGI